MNEDPEQLKERARLILTSRNRYTISDPTLVCASVLIPLVFEDDTWHVVVTQRTQAVEHHKGQISFPGGACEPGDGSQLETALRETHEEIGVPPEAVEVLGVLDDFPTITHFVVTPYVGMIPAGFPYRLNDGEVEAVVEVPLPFLLEPSHLRVEQWVTQGMAHDVLFWDYGGYTIWGLTARILKSFLELVF